MQWPSTIARRQAAVADDARVLHTPPPPQMCATWQTPCWGAGWSTFLRCASSATCWARCSRPLQPRRLRARCGLAGQTLAVAAPELPVLCACRRSSASMLPLPLLHLQEAQRNKLAWTWTVRVMQQNMETAPGPAGGVRGGAGSRWRSTAFGADVRMHASVRRGCAAGAGAACDEPRVGRIRGDGVVHARGAARCASFTCSRADGRPRWRARPRHG